MKYAVILAGTKSVYPDTPQLSSLGCAVSLHLGECRWLLLTCMATAVEIPVLRAAYITARHKGDRGSATSSSSNYHRRHIFP